MQNASLTSHPNPIRILILGNDWLTDPRHAEEFAAHLQNRLNSLNASRQYRIDINPNYLKQISDYTAFLKQQDLSLYDSALFLMQTDTRILKTYSQKHPEICETKTAGKSRATKTDTVLAPFFSEFQELTGYLKSKNRKLIVLGTNPQFHPEFLSRSFPSCKQIRPWLQNQKITWDGVIEHAGWQDADLSITGAFLNAFLSSYKRSKDEASFHQNFKQDLTEAVIPWILAAKIQ